MTSKICTSSQMTWKTCHGTDHGTKPCLQTQPDTLAILEHKLCWRQICICWDNVRGRGKWVNIVYNRCAAGCASGMVWFCVNFRIEMNGWKHRLIIALWKCVYLILRNELYLGVHNKNEDKYLTVSQSQLTRKCLRSGVRADLLVLI